MRKDSADDRPHGGHSTREWQAHHTRVDGLEVIDSPEVLEQLRRYRRAEPEDGRLPVDCEKGTRDGKRDGRKGYIKPGPDSLSRYAPSLSIHS
jgi:hypothetical protein